MLSKFQESLLFQAWELAVFSSKPSAPVYKIVVESSVSRRSSPIYPYIIYVASVSYLVVHHSRNCRRSVTQTICLISHFHSLNRRIMSAVLSRQARSPGSELSTRKCHCSCHRSSDNTPACALLLPSGRRVPLFVVLSYSSIIFWIMNKSSSSCYLTQVLHQKIQLLTGDSP